MPKIKIRCEAIAKHSGKRCKCLGKFIPTSRRMLCGYHKGAKSWDNKTKKYVDPQIIQRELKKITKEKNFAYKRKKEYNIKNGIKPWLKSET